MTIFRNDFENLISGHEVNFIGREKEVKEILYRVQSGSLLVIEGPSGSGRGELLKSIIDNFGGNKKIIYLDVKKYSKRLDVLDFVNEDKKGMILLLDNVESLSFQNSEKIKYCFDQDYLKSVIFTTTDFKKANFSDALRTRIGNNVLKVEKMSTEDSLKIVKERIPKHLTISDEILEALYDETETISEFLKVCNEICGFLEKENKKEVEVDDLTKIEIGEDKVLNKNEICEDCKSDLVNIKEHWRCPECDTFCEFCGSLMRKNELNCPSCNKEKK